MDKLIKRVFGVNELSALLIGELNKPLLMQPTMISETVKSLLTMSTLNNASINDNGDSSVQVNRLTKAGAVVLDISGALVDREMSVPCAASPVSYEGIRFELDRALKAEVRPKHIIARFNSGGGMASGMMELASTVVSLKKENPDVKFHAVIDSSCYSAAFGLAAAFGDIWIPKTGGAGSVGVVLRHVDESKALRKAGIKTNFIYAGKKKVLGNSSNPLSDSDLTSLQSEVDVLYDMFVESVATSLRISVKSVRDTEAGTFMGQDAIDVGFAHNLGTFKDLCESLLNDDNEVSKMDKEGRNVTQAKLDAAHVELKVQREAMVLNENLLAKKTKKAKKAAKKEKAATAHKVALTELIDLSNISASVGAAIIASAPSLSNAKTIITELTSSNSEISYTQRENELKDAQCEWDENLNIKGGT